MKGARFLPDCRAPDSLWVEGTVVQSQFKSKTQVSSLLRLLVSLMVADELFPLFASPQMFHGCHCLWAYKNMILTCLVDSHSWNPLSLLVTFRWCDWYIWTNGKLNGKTTHFHSLIMNLSHHCFTQKKSEPCPLDTWMMPHELYDTYETCSIFISAFVFTLNSSAF